MLEKLILQIKTQSTIKAAILIALIVIGAYAPVIFLGQSYNQTNPIYPKFIGIDGKSFLFSTSIDPAGVSPQNPPSFKLARDLILQGHVPLWNPYIGTGSPLAADTDYYIFSPLMLGYLLPVEFWDLPLYVSLWMAGFFTFLFLRSLGLKFQSSIAGGIFYMFSGMFTWFLPHTITAVLPFAPFVFYSLEKLLQTGNRKYFFLMSISTTCLFLGAHLESIVLQLFFIGTYFCYRVLAIIKQSRNNDLYKSFPSMLNQIVFKPITAFLSGISLSAFFILPVYEFLKNGSIAHTPSIIWNTDVVSPLSLSINFIPYLHGTLHTNWSYSWSIIQQWTNEGYVGIFVLFFSLIGFYVSFKIRDNIHGKTPMFFFIISFFFIFVTARFPIIGWFGNLPLFNLIALGRYSGEIFTLGLAITAAFGIDFISQMKISKKSLITITIIAISIILTVSLPVIEYLKTEPTNFNMHTNGAEYYVGFQILQSLLLIIGAFLISLAAIRNYSIQEIIILALLELCIYIPMGLDPLWMFYKSILLLSGMAFFIVIFSKYYKSYWFSRRARYQQFVALFAILIIFGTVIVSVLSPAGMLGIRDPFKDYQAIGFLKTNLGNSRVFSLDTFAPNFPSAYDISTLGLMSAFSIGSFHHFSINFLDQENNSTSLDYPPWVYEYGPANSVEKLYNNKKYFDFLGVKYYIASDFDLNSYTPGVSSTYNFTQIGSNENSIGQSFVSSVETIKSIGISLGTYSLKNDGRLLLTVDSIPFNEQYHRESSIAASAINSTAFNYFYLEPPLSDVKGKMIYFSLQYPETKDNTQKIAAYLIGNSSVGFNSGLGVVGYDASRDYSIGYDIIKNKLKGNLYQNGSLVEGKVLDFSIVDNSENYTKVFESNGLKIYENPESFPRAFLVNKFVMVETNKSQDYLLNHPEFDLRNSVILEKQLPSNQTTLLNSQQQIIDANANITSYSTDKVQIYTQSNSASLLILTDSYYPGWHAYLDGKETPIYLADGLVRTIFVPAGDHNVEFSYEPMSFKIGLIISLTTAIIITSCLLYLKIRTKKLPETI